MRLISFAASLFVFLLALVFVLRFQPAAHAGTLDITGYVDGISANSDGASACLKGWAFYEADHSREAELEVWLDGKRNTGKLYTTLIADVSRPDVDAAYGLDGRTYHGFNLCLSEDLFDGRTHTLYVYAQDFNRTAWHELSGSGATFTDTADAQLRGSFDGVVINWNDKMHPSATGWAIDYSNVSVKVPLLFTVGPMPVMAAQTIGSGLADVYRQDLVGALGMDGVEAFNARLNLEEQGVVTGTTLDIYAYVLDVNDGRLKQIGMVTYVAP